MKNTPQVPQITEDQIVRYNQYLVGEAIKRAVNLATARCTIIIALLLMGYEVPYHAELNGAAFYVGGFICLFAGISILVNRRETTSEI